MITYKIKNPDGPYGDLLIDGEDFTDAVTNYISNAHHRGGDRNGIEVAVDEEGGTSYHPLRAVAMIRSGHPAADRQMIIYGKESRRFGRPELGGRISTSIGGDLLSQVDALAEQRGKTRAEVIRYAITAYIADAEAIRHLEPQGEPS